jgi:hypothetical protein
VPMFGRRQNSSATRSSESDSEERGEALNIGVGSKGRPDLESTGGLTIILSRAGGTEKVREESMVQAQGGLDSRSRGRA